MAYTPTESLEKGHQLTELKLACEANLQQVVAQTALASHVIVGSGMGLPKFRMVMNLNVGAINTALTTTYPTFDSGDTVWDCRAKAKAMFDDIGANDV